MIILGTNSIKDTGFDVANSVRFNRGDSAYMHKTPSSAGNVDVWTFSAWIKVAETGGHRNIFAQTGGSATSQRAYILLNSSGQLYISQYTGSATNFQLVPNRLLRDESAWYHIVVAVDTTQGTDTNRLKLYINGVQETSFETATYPSQNLDTYVNAADQPMAVGYDPKVSSRHFGGYMAEVVLIDGQQLAADQFGEFDEDSGIWKPIDVSGLTAGTNGFYLDFEDSSNLGNDAFGGTDLTEVNLAATDQTTDTCTNNFATINPLDNYYAQATLSEGNTKVATNASAEAMSTSTFAMTKGRWYFEVDFISNSGSVSRQCGITPHPSQVMSGISGKSGDVTPNTHAYSDSGNLQTGNGSGGQTALATLSSFTNGDIIGIYMDLEDMKSYWSKNGSLMNSGTGIDLTALASNGTGHYMFYVGDNNSAAQTCEANFGNGFQALSSAVTDDNGYGAFEYSPNITGDGTAKSFYSCCTKNLAEYG